MDESLINLLFKYARASIKAGLSGEEFTPKRVPEELRISRGVFVTLELNDSLRGCIGYLKPKPLWRGVIQASRASAFNDPRFKPLTESEFSELLIEISILSKPVSCSVKEVEKGDGVILEKNGRNALFLPQVWIELPDKIDFLSHLCLKAGLSGDCYRSASFRKFSVEAWREERDDSSIIIVPVIP